MEQFILLCRMSGRGMLNHGVSLDLVLSLGDNARPVDLFLFNSLIGCSPPRGLADSLFDE